VIFGLSRNLVFAAIAATAVAGGGLWFVLSEDEPSAPAAQRESVATQESVTPAPAVEESVSQEPVSDEIAREEDAIEDVAVEEDAAEDVAAEEAAPRDEADAEPAGDIEELFTADTADAREDAPADSADADAESVTAEDEAEALAPTGLAFDIIRIEPTGEAVIAGRGAPDARVALLRNGAVHDETMSDASGNFVFIPEPFPVGTSDVTLRATGSDGADLVSQESLTIVVDEDRRRQPMVARIAPGQPTEVLSRPEPEPVALAETATDEVVAEQSATEESTTEEVVADVTTTPSAEDGIVEEPAAESVAQAADETTETPVADTAEEATAERSVAALDATSPAEEPVDTRIGVRIVAVEAETGGGLFVSGEAEAQAAIRLYLNDTLVAQAEANETGDVSFAIQRGVRAGRYQVRLDDVEPATGTVLSRAEVGFTVPEAVAALPEPAPLATAQADTDADVEADAEEAPVADVAEEAADEAATAVAESAATDPQASAGEGAAEGETLQAASEPAAGRAEASVTVPELATALVERGDSLWRISRQIYGRGIRYTEIFEANQDQIRNPDLIFPGQVFVLPPDQEPGETLEAPPAQ
jgi:nucleoid-associated protein YgaU